MGTTIDNEEGQPDPIAQAWAQLRGSLKEIYADLGGGEAYLRAERGNFENPPDEHGPGGH